MLTARLFEEKAAELYTLGHISGFCHLYIGQEAVIVGIAHNMLPQDSSVTSYRDHAHMLTFGVSPEKVMSELCGKITGCSKGKGGSMPVTFVGDGAANQGQVYEAFNMASLWKLPVLYVLENNHYAMGTAAKRAVSGESLKTRGDAFGIKTISVDGMDILDVIEKSKEAIDKVRSTSTPVILHVDTYRYRGHSMSDPATYRTREEVNNVKKTRDPITGFKTKLVENFGINEKQFDEMEEEITKIIENSAKFAIEAQFPDASELYKDVIL